MNNNQQKNRKPVSRTIKTLTHQETTLLLNELCAVESEADRTPKKIRNYVIALLMLDAGLRVGEVVGLQIRDLIFNGEPVLALTIRPEISKSKSERTLPLSTRLREAIKFMITTLPNAGVVPRGRAMFCRSGLWDASEDQNAPPYTSISTRQIQRLIAGAAWASLGYSIHPHSLRHTFGTRLAKVLPIKGVQDALGHRQLSSTQVYVHPDAESLKNAVDTIAENHTIDPSNP